MKNVLIERFPSQAIDIFHKQLKNLMNIKIVVYNGEKFPVYQNIEILNSLSISKGIHIDKCPWSINNTEQKYFSAYEGIFLSILSRYDIYKTAFTTEEMLDHYYRLINFWIHKTKDIDAVFSLDTPHVPSSFALHLVAKFLKIPFIHMDFALVYNKFHFFVCSFRYRMLLVQKEQLTSNLFITAHNNFYNEYNSSPDGVLNKYVEFLENRVHSLWWRMLAEDINSSIPISIKSIFKGMIRLRGFRTTELGWKISRKRWDDPGSGFFRPFLFFAKLIDRIKIKFAKTRYRNICKDYKTLDSFIFFAATMEPEAAILPTALDGRYTAIALRRIAEKIPHNCSIVYKEHPGNFDQQVLFTTKWKSKYYYEDLKKIGNIVFVRDDIPIKDLIDGSMGVATINGTIGLEALMGGKRCITFAPQWYDDFDGLHCVKSSNDIENALNLMTNKVPPNPNPNQVKFSKHFIDLDGYNLSTYSKEDFEKICKGIWEAYKDFLDIDDRKWEV